MKKFTIFVIVLLMFLGAFCGCSPKVAYPDTEKIDIVCTIYPSFDWIREIIGEKSDGFNITLIGGGQDIHSFSPSVQDILKASMADLFVGVNGVTDSWTYDIDFKEDTKKISLFDFLEESDKLTLDGEHHDHHHEGNEHYDEHIWLSLRLAGKMVNALCDEICELDPQNAVIYKRNTINYCMRLDQLEAKYHRATNDIGEKVIIFADRYPFRYLMNDFGIDCVAAFTGCSSDTDASFETVFRLKEAVEKYKKNTVIVLENSDKAVVDAVNKILTGKEIEAVTVNSCQSIDKDSLDKGYIEIMTKNLVSFEKALGSSCDKGGE